MKGKKNSKKQKRKNQRRKSEQIGGLEVENRTAIQAIRADLLKSLVLSVLLMGALVAIRAWSPAYNCIGRDTFETLERSQNETI